jgi:hypothetical protein
MLTPVAFPPGRFRLSTSPILTESEATEKTTTNLAVVGSQVTTFIVERLRNARGALIAASELRLTYEVWCAAHRHTPLSSPKFAAELKALGYDKWKSCGLIRYRDLQVA